jgi:hypothetical protein
MNKIFYFFLFSKMDKKIIIIAVIVLIILVGIYFMYSSSPNWAGTWKGTTSAADVWIIEKDGSGWVILDTARVNKMSPVINGSSIMVPNWGGVSGTISGNTISWTNGNIWTRQ